jgi:alpha-D-xyloside xylohydrolase
LPKGKWYDFYNGNFVGDGQVITITPGLAKIPVFVKEGGIIPLMPPLLHAPKAGEKVDLEIRVYGKKPAVSRLYDDDGETFAYEKDQYSWRDLIVEEKNGVLKGRISEAESGKPNNIGRVKWHFITKSIK